IDFTQKGHFLVSFSEWFQRFGETNFPSFFLAVGGVFILIIFKKFKIPVPGALVLVLGGILLTRWGNLDAMGVKILGKIPGGFPELYLPKLNWTMFRDLLPAGFAISLVGFLESFSIAKTMQRIHNNYKLRANQELVALGTVNMMAALVRAFPITGGFSRTAVNHQAGA
ncbi:MAG: SulP family inorganic anion transporter, partial [Saprospiraceae bacterium]|nr:SulP family inorganic anion transporter [Saprospiraceae bacterium]